MYFVRTKAAYTGITTRIVIYDHFDNLHLFSTVRSQGKCVFFNHVFE